MSNKKKDDAEHKVDEVLEGPDLNGSKSPHDKKLYKQILLPNGLRCVLVSDTVAMTQMHNAGGLFVDDSDDDESDSDTSGVDMSGGEQTEGEGRPGESGCDDEGSSDAEEDEEEGGGLRVAAAAMVVGVGSLYDPPECQGMAHFLEHLLFMGSERYPEENAYDAFMSAHGGSDNAWTELEHTVYHFEISQEYLQKALDMFAQFFTAPLLLENSVERELNAIESEFQLAKNNDGSRAQQLISHTCGYSPEEHPFAKFSWGNLKSLKETPEIKNVDALAMLKDFYNQYYYASNMRLVVVGAYTLEELEKQVLTCFSDIPRNPRPVSTATSFYPVAPVPEKFTWEDTYQSAISKWGLPMKPDRLQKLFVLAPVKERHAITVTWQIPPIFDQWRSKPTDFLAHLIGHEAKGSLLASLKEKSWVTACYAGVGCQGFENCSSHALFSCTLTLSEEGVSHWKAVVSELYMYIGMLRYHCQEGLPEWLFDELKSVQDVAHKYGDEQSPEDLVENLAEELAPNYNMPPERLLDGTMLLFDFEPEKIKTIIDNYFNPQNARVDISSSTFGRSSDYEDSDINASEKLVILPASENDVMDISTLGPPQQEPMFGTYYWCMELSASLLHEWSNLSQPQLPPPDSSLALPLPNPFIPSRFDLKQLPLADLDHPLVNSSLKVQLTVGKKKQWLPATVTQYNSPKNQVLLSYEDEDEKWHFVDSEPSSLTTTKLLEPSFEGSFDKKSIKYRIVALAREGDRAIRKFGDESDFEAEEGKRFPAIPPATPPSRLPKLVHNTNYLKLYHLQDRTFKRPIAELRLQVHCARANENALFSACSDLLVHLFSDAMTETAYLASVCEIGSSISANDSGLTLRVHGFDDKLESLFFDMLKLLLSFRGRSASDGLPPAIKTDRFDACLEVYRRSCTNSGMKASALSKGVRIRCLRANTQSANQKLKAVEHLTEKDFVETIASLLDKIGLECLYHGNVNIDDANRLKEGILQQLQDSETPGLQRKKYPAQLVTRIPESTSTLTVPNKDPTDPNTAVEIYIQVGKDNLPERVMLDVLSELLYEPMYDQIRTKDQFGYSVSCDSRWTNGVMGMYFQVVTASKTAKEATDRVDQFLRDHRKELENMTQEKFFEHTVGLAHHKLEMYNSLSEETSAFWSEIRDGRFAWEVNRDEAIHLSTINKEEALKAYDNWLHPDNPRRRMLIIQVVSRFEESPASKGCPTIQDGGVGDFIDDAVSGFVKSCKGQTFGRIY